MGCALKALCLTISLLLLSLPAAADEVLSSAPGPQVAETETDGLYRLEWLRKKIADEDAAVAAVSKSENAAEAEFAQKVRNMLALAREHVRRAAHGPNPVDIRVRIRCVSKQVVMTSGSAGRPFVPALAWSAASTEQAPTTVTRKTAKACKIRLTTTPSKKGSNGGSLRAESATQLQPFAVELTPIEQVQ